MTRNEKIILGCGIAGVVGIIALIVLCSLAFFFWRVQRRPIASYERNYNSNSNRNANRNFNSAPDRPAPSSGMTEDEQHRLFQAASVTRDPEVLRKVSKKLGLIESDGTPNAAYWKFISNHMGWAIRDSEFLSTISTPEQAQAYVDLHIDD